MLPLLSPFLLALAVTPPTCVHAPLQVGDAWVERYTHESYWPLQQQRQKRVCALEAGRVTALEVTNLDECSGMRFLIQAHGATVSVNGEVLGQPQTAETLERLRARVQAGRKDECWSDSRLSAQLGMTFLYPAPTTGLSFDEADRAFSLLRPWRQREDGMKPKVTLKRKGRRQHALGPAHVLHVKLRVEDGSASMGHVAEDWLEDLEGDIVRLDGTNLIVEAHLVGKVVYTLTGPQAGWDGESNPSTVVSSQETKKARLDLVCQCPDPTSK